MEFLFKSRSQGKRQIKPSQDIQYLEETFAQESSEDSDFKLDSALEDQDGDASSVSSSGEDPEEEDAVGGDPGDECRDLELLEQSSEDLCLTSRDLVGIASQQKSEKDEKEEERLLLSFRVCACCLGQSSNDANEIVECDGCGISVHEACYGVSESGSIASNISEASTEPWFCDPCQSGILTSPVCELCPVIGGVYKETDVGRWVHLVCALYVNGVAFGDLDRLSAITIFEINYSNWGKKACGLCEQSRFARTGICIQCDAGMCRSSFHATCAQAMGLLSEPIFTETDPYIAHCRLHSDKSAIKARKRLYTISKRQAERRKALILKSWEGQNICSTSSRPLPDETPSQRILRKLNRRRSRYLSGKKNDLPLPFKKTPRFLSSSASAIRKTQRLEEMVSGLSVDRQKAKEAQYIAIQEIHKKWNLPPSFNVEFVAYYHDRQIRLRDFKKTLSDQMKSAAHLRTLQSETQANYEATSSERDSAMKTNSLLRDKIKFYRNTLSSLGVTLPLEHLILTRPPAFPTEASNGNVASHSAQSALDSPSNGCSSSSQLLNLNKCGVCSRTNDQHLIIPCDTCLLHYHLGCLNPPLTRMPKRSKLYKWQCSECDKLSSEDEAHQMDVSGPRRLRYKKPRSKGREYSSEEEEDLIHIDFSPTSKEGQHTNGGSHEAPSLIGGGGGEAQTQTTTTLVSARAEKKRLKKERKREKKRRKLQKLVPAPIVNEDDASSDGVQIVDEEEEENPIGESKQGHPPPIKIKIRNLYDGPPLPEMESPTGPKNKKKRLSADARDVRTFCNKCEASGVNSNLVRCDECKKCYHFSCLIPPLKKSPKVAGYGWHCNECDPSDVDSDWHLD